MSKYSTLITGGSAGIGRSFAFECARRKMNLLLVALPGPELKQIADEILKLIGTSRNLLVGKADRRI